MTRSVISHGWTGALAGAALTAIGVAAGGAPAAAGSVDSVAGCTGAIYTPFLLGPSLLGQASDCGNTVPAGNQAQSRAIREAADGLQNQVLGGVITGFVPGIFPTGRLATTHHKGEDVTVNPTFKGPAYDVNEASVLANIEFGLSRSQSTSSRLGLFAGYANTEVKYANGQAKGGNDSGMVGGYGVYTFGQSYVMGMLGADFGQTEYTLNDIGNRGSYDTSGYMASLTAGHVLNVAPNWFLDVRGTLGYGHHTGDSHVARTTVATSGDFQVGKSEHEVFYGSAMLTLYTIVKNGGAVYQPYVRAGLKGEFDEESTLRLPAQTILAANGGTTTVGDARLSFSDSDLYGHAELGVNMQLSKSWEAGVAGYWWGSSDENTFGGRLGVKYKFD